MFHKIVIDCLLPATNIELFVNRSLDNSLQSNNFEYNVIKMDIPERSALTPTKNIRANRNETEQK